MSRRRKLSASVLIFLIVFCIFKYVRRMTVNDHNEDDEEDELPKVSDNEKIPNKSILLQQEILYNLSISDITFTDDLNELFRRKSCQNSIQGSDLIVDDRGYVCSRYDLLSNGCCDVGIKKTTKKENRTNIPYVRKKQFTCKNCKSNGCCDQYEYCVSCCLHPNKRKTKTQNVKYNPKFKASIYIGQHLSNLSRFELCLTICRTSSASLNFESKYANPSARYCYILQIPIAPLAGGRERKLSLNYKSEENCDFSDYIQTSVFLLLSKSCI